ncbi:MAG: peptide-methionine (S)-S-oxide reductase MsrA, partial [Nitrospira sp.]
MAMLRRLTFLAIGLLICATFAPWPSTGLVHASTQAKAYFAGGCFWCMEEAFEKVDGVIAVVSGYMGGTVANPTYEQVSDGRTGHAESIEVTYDPTKITYQKLLDAFWRNVDPITPNAQFCDHGTQYRAVVFYSTDEEKRLSEESKSKLEQSKRFPA